MQRDIRLPRMIQVLLHMSQFDGPVTSRPVAEMLKTNSVVVRRTMGSLRRAGLVRSERGGGGGWFLACDLAQVSLFDIYMALDRPEIFAIGRRMNTSGSLIEQQVNKVLQTAFSDAAAALIAQLRSITLADLAENLGKSGASCEPLTMEHIETV